jgi:hypothetical protein
MAHVLFQDLHSVTSGFGGYDRGSIGRRFNYNVPVAIDFPWQQFLQFGHQSPSMASQVGRSGLFASGALSPHWDVFEPKDPQGQETSTSPASLGVGTVGETYPYVQLHSIRSYSTGHIFGDGLGIPSVL